MHSSMLRYALPARESSIFRGRWYKQNQMDRSIIWGSFLTAFCIQDKKRSVNYKTNPVLLHKDTWMDGAVPFCFPFPGSAMREKKPGTVFSSRKLSPTKAPNACVRARRHVRSWAKAGRAWSQKATKAADKSSRFFFLADGGTFMRCNTSCPL